METPSYIELFNRGELKERSEALRSLLGACTLCPHQCLIDRLNGQKGKCRAGEEIEISSAFPHFGEEPPLTGTFGSGTIFLTHCNLHCIFCQNWDISHEGDGEKSSARELAATMIALQSRGCHNINFVTPTHYAPQIVEGIYEAACLGLEIPIVWNCGGYESLEVIKLLEGIVDIYMPDVKFFSSTSAKRYAKAPNYFPVVKEVLKEMYRQVGDLQKDERGIAVKGILVRHLVMPGQSKDTEAILQFLSQEVSPTTAINVMDQYSPHYKASQYPEISRPLQKEEWIRARELKSKWSLPDP